MQRIQFWQAGLCSGLAFINLPAIEPPGRGNCFTLTQGRGERLRAGRRPGDEVLRRHSQGGPARTASLGSGQAVPREDLGVPAARPVMSPVTGAGWGCSGGGLGPETIRACFLTQMTNGGSEGGTGASLKKSLNKRKYQVQIVAMNCRGRLLKGGETGRVAEPTLGPAFPCNVCK